MPFLLGVAVGRKLRAVADAVGEAAESLINPFICNLHQQRNRKRKGVNQQESRKPEGVMKWPDQQGSAERLQTYLSFVQNSDNVLP